MTHMYTSRRRTDFPVDALAHAPETKGPSLQALQSGAVPSAEQLGHPVDLPGAIRAKMEASFGADLSGVRLYESQTVADAGAEAVTMGNRIGFAPGKLDFSSSSGQALLGHELSHVVSQARGEVTGSGFLNDRVLEARADQEGAMAAAGENVYSGPVTPISTFSTAQAAGPMQAKKPLEKFKEHQEQKEQARYAKEIQDMEISEPQAVKHENYITESDGNFIINYSGKESKDIRSYKSSIGAAIGLMMQGKTDEELREDKMLQEVFLEQYKKDTAARLKEPGGGKHSLNLDLINAEQSDYNRMLQANISEDMINHMAITNSDLVGKALDKAGENIQQNKSLKKLLIGGADAMMDVVGGDRDKANAGILERFARKGLAPALSKKDKEVRRRKAARDLGPNASEKAIQKEAEEMGRLNAGNLGSNILDRFDHAKEGEEAKKMGNSRVFIGARPINTLVFEGGDLYKNSLQEPLSEKQTQNVEKKRNDS